MDVHSVGFPSLNIILSLSALSDVSVVHYLGFCCSLSLILDCLCAVLPVCTTKNSLLLKVRQRICVIFFHFLLLMQASHTSFLFIQMYSVHYSNELCLCYLDYMQLQFIYKIEKLMFWSIKPLLRLVFSSFFRFSRQIYQIG